MLVALLLPAEQDAAVVVPAAVDLEAETLTLRQGLGGGLAESGPVSSPGPGFRALAGPVLVLAWLLGTTGLLAWTIARTVRFRGSLATASRRAPEWLRREAAAVGRALGLARTPEVRTADARVTPLVWWTGGRVRVLVPALLLTELTAVERRAILAHELAHVRRRNHLVRWLEWLACSVFWWNPVAWWARRELRMAEESCCDRVALDAAGSPPRAYANALLRVVAGTSSRSGPRPPPPRGRRHRGGTHPHSRKETRNDRFNRYPLPAPRRLRAVTWTVALCTLPLGLVYCGRPSAPVEPEVAEDEAAVEVDAAVAAAEHDLILLEEEASEIMERLRRLALAEAWLTRELEQHLREARESAGPGEVVPGRPEDTARRPEDTARRPEDAARRYEDAVRSHEEFLEAFRSVAHPPRPLLVAQALELRRSPCPRGQRRVTAAEAYSDSRKPQLMATLTELVEHLDERRSTPVWTDRFEKLQARYRELMCTGNG